MFINHSQLIGLQLQASIHHQTPTLELDNLSPVRVVDLIKDSVYRYALYIFISYGVHVRSPQMLKSLVPKEREFQKMGKSVRN